MERITGPHLGHYIASHACETGADGDRFLGYAKLCRRRPESYWDANCVVRICGERLHDRPQDALTEVEVLARHQLRNLVPEGEPAST